MPPEIITVKLGERDYDIMIGKGLLKDAARFISPHLGRPRVFIVTDQRVAKLHLESLEKSLQVAGIETHALVLKAGEQTKSFAELQKLLNALLKCKPERSDTLIAFGGGVIGDITGFAASILLRGVCFIQIPTTLLAMVDSSVGGKTGINTQYGKNVIGTFYQPRLVLVDVLLLNTLPERELLAGYAEVVKYGLINDLQFFEKLEKEAPKKLLARDSAFLSFIVKRSCAAKAAIVGKDEKESGVRALLNLGHTFGHALETETGYGKTLLHGEAVAIGMVLAFQLSCKLGLCKQEDAERVEKNLQSVGLRTAVKEIKGRFSASGLLNHMRQDKKVKQGKLVFILVKGIGKAFVAKDVHEKDVKNFLRKCLM